MPDFFAFSKILPLFFYPLPLILIIIFVASWWIKKNPVRWVIRLFVVLLWALSTPWAANLVSSVWEIPRSTRAQLPAVSDVAVVLGGMTNPAISTPEHLEFNQAAERLTEAVALYKEGRVKALLITSGSGDLLDQSSVEAPGLAAWARSMGVPAEALMVESKSRNTRENATLSLPLAEAKGFRSFVLVTSAAHMRRSEAIFRKAGYDKAGRTLALWAVDSRLDVTKFPFNAVAAPSSLATVQGVIKEAVGYAVYFFQGYL
jgi:uncharacterized SAM-binding protein YcdF (DUF218 family)